MKKFIAVLLLVVLMLCAMPACGAINKTGEVSVLWANLADEYQFTISDALDRAMYIENIKYTHYDAKNDSKTQLEQADTAIANGACALIACVTDPINATVILEKAKKANIPVVFLCNNQLSDLTLSGVLSVSTYDKCFIVNEDFDNSYYTLAKKVANDLLENYDKYDKNHDGKITFSAFGKSLIATEMIDKILQENGKEKLVFNADYVIGTIVSIEASIDLIFKDYKGEEQTPVELILTDSDDYIEEMLLALRKYGLNHEKLVTHFIPLYTIGVSANAGKLIESDKQEEKDAFSVMNTIDKGWVSASALQDDDALALSACKILANLIKGKTALDGINKDLVDGNTVTIPYTIYG